MRRFLHQVGACRCATAISSRGAASSAPGGAKKLVGPATAVAFTLGVGYFMTRPPTALRPVAEFGKGKTAVEWVNMGVAGGGRVADEDHSALECFGMALNVDPRYTLAWCNAGFAGGGVTVDGVPYGQKDCYTRALEINSGYFFTWCGGQMTMGDGTPKDRWISAYKSFVDAVAADESDVASWVSLGMLGGGAVCGEELPAKQCFEEALERNENYSRGWLQLGLANGGFVNNRDVNRPECYALTLAQDPKNGKAWQLLGQEGGGGFGGKTYTARECDIMADIMKGAHKL
jgi:hypothetical protein